MEQWPARDRHQSLGAALPRLEQGGLTCCGFSPPHPGNSAFKSPDAFKVSLPLRTNYLYGKIKKTLPELYAFTICLWLRSSASPGIGTPFSYAVPGQANEIVLIEWGNNPIELLINDKVGLLAALPSLGQQVLVLRGGASGGRQHRASLYHTVQVPGHHSRLHPRSRAHRHASAGRSSLWGQLRRVSEGWQPGQE